MDEKIHPLLQSLAEAYGEKFKWAREVQDLEFTTHLPRTPSSLGVVWECDTLLKMFILEDRLDLVQVWYGKCYKFVADLTGEVSYGWSSPCGDLYDNHYLPVNDIDLQVYAFVE